LSDRKVIFAASDKIYLVVCSTENSSEGGGGMDSECKTPILAYKRKKYLGTPLVSNTLSAVVIYGISFYLHAYFGLRFVSGCDAIYTFNSI